MSSFSVMFKEILKRLDELEKGINKLESCIPSNRIYKNGSKLISFGLSDEIGDIEYLEWNDNILAVKWQLAKELFYGVTGMQKTKVCDWCESNILGECILFGFLIDEPEIETCGAWNKK